jgi:MFS family permease
MPLALQALKERNYRAYVGAFLCSSTGLQLMSTAIAYELYERTKDVMMLGWAGVARALPVVLLALPAGQLIDSLPRHRVMSLTMLGLGVAGGLLAFVSSQELPAWVMLGIICLAGFVRTFNGPSRASLLPDIVTTPAFANAVTWNTAAFQVSAIGGPLIAGYMLTFLNPLIDPSAKGTSNPTCWPVYALTCALCTVGALQSLAIKPLREHPRKTITIANMRQGMSDGVSHIVREKVVFGAITLSLSLLRTRGLIFLRTILLGTTSLLKRVLFYL